MIDNQAAGGSGAFFAHWLKGEQAAHLLVRYMTVGAVSALAEFILFQGLYALAGLPLMVANGLAIGSVVAFGFFGQKRFTFRNGGPAMRQAGPYLLMIASSFVLNNALVYLFVVVLGWPTALAKVLQLGMCFVFNFTVSRYIVFGRRVARV